MTTRGSEWRRWDPHIHAPGTLLNNQFGGADPWAEYLATLEGSVPRIEVIAATDYYVTDTYEQMLAHKATDRLRDVGLLFPNIEVRLDVAAKSGFVNLHLLAAEARRLVTFGVFARQHAAADQAEGMTAISQ